MDLPSVKEVARATNVQTKPQYKKEEIIEHVLRNHPLALVEDLPSRAKPAKRKRTDSSTEAQAKRIKKELVDLRSKIPTLEVGQPEFATVYTESYGWQDRANGLIYDNFTHTSSSTPEAKLAWTTIFIPLINAYGLWRELKLEKLPNAASKIAASDKHLHLERL